MRGGRGLAPGAGLSGGGACCAPRRRTCATPVSRTPPSPPFLVPSPCDTHTPSVPCAVPGWGDRALSAAGRCEAVLCPAPLPQLKGCWPRVRLRGLVALVGMVLCAKQGWVCTSSLHPQLSRVRAPDCRGAAFLMHTLSSAFQDLVKSHLMYAVREEVEVLKEQIKELIEKNSQLEQENTLLKTLASPEQLAQFQAQLQTGSPPSSSQSQGTTQQPAQPASQGSGPSA